MTKEIVSIVIPTHNRCGLLKETVASIFSQTTDNWELIIVDDASEDDTWSWLRGLDDSRVKKIRLKQSAERSRARNLGLQSANGQFVLFLDDDDLLPEQALQTHLKSLEKYPAAIASIGSYSMFNEEGLINTIRIVRRTMLRHIEHDILFGWMAVSGQSLFLTENIRALNGWDESYSFAEDHHLWLRMSCLGPVVLLPDIVHNYRVHGQPRPDDAAQIMTEIRERAVSRKHGRERKIGEGILQARALEPIAYEHYERPEAFNALCLYLKIARLAPSLLQSPLTRRTILAPMTKCLAGNLGLRVGRPLLSWLRRKLSHRPDSAAV